MKMYLVDLTSLPMQERRAAVQKIGVAAWDIYEQLDLDAIKVAWDRSEDFCTSPVFPIGCPCRECYD